MRKKTLDMKEFWKYCLATASCAQGLAWQRGNKTFEDAWLVGLSYNFSRFGLAGLSTFVNYADGNTPDNGPTAAPDQKEIDFTIDYTFGRLPLEGFWIRARYAHVDQDGPAAVDIDVYDWQDDIDSVTIAAPEITGAPSTPFIFSTGNTWSMPPSTL